MKTTVVADGLKEMAEYFERAPAAAHEAAFLAVYTVSERDAITLGRDEMNSQVNFPAGYLNKDRLYVSKKANRQDLEAVVTGRDRPTSLARFVKNPVPGQRGVSVEVHKGRTKYMKKAFIVRLRSGRTMDGKTFNVGLAIRLAPGERLHNRREAGNVDYAMLAPNVYLLYGPSVDQVFQSVSQEIAPEVGNRLAAEFLRQFVRLTSG